MWLVLPHEVRSKGEGASAKHFLVYMCVCGVCECVLLSILKRIHFLSAATKNSNKKKILEWIDYIFTV